MSNLPADAALTLRKKRGFSVCSVAGSRSRDYQSDPHFQCGIALRAFSVWDASRSKTYGLPFRGKNAVMPLTLGRAALCPPPRRLPFHRQNASIPLPHFFPTTRAPHFSFGALLLHYGTFSTQKTVFRRKNAVFRQTSSRTAWHFAEKHAHSVHVGPGGAVPPRRLPFSKANCSNAVR